jgi:hypothetical protein
MPIAGDQRAWDATVTKGRAWCAIDAETRIHDLQAVERRVGLKQRDAGVEVVILLVRNSRWNRQVLRMWSDAIHSTFPGSGAVALEALRDGNLPTSSCVMLL